MRNEDRLHQRVLAWIRRLFLLAANRGGGTREAPPQARTPAVGPPKTWPIRAGRQDFAFGCVRPQGEGYWGVVVMNTGEPLHPSVSARPTRTRPGRYSPSCSRGERRFGHAAAEPGYVRGRGESGDDLFDRGSTEVAPDGAGGSILRAREAALFACLHASVHALRRRRRPGRRRRTSGRPGGTRPPVWRHRSPGSAVCAAPRSRAAVSRGAYSFFPPLC